MGIFKSRFETGDLTEFTDQMIASGSLTVDGAYKRRGSYGLEACFTANNGLAFAGKNVTQLSRLYQAAWIQAKKDPPGTQRYIAMNMKVGTSYLTPSVLSAGFRGSPAGMRVTFGYFTDAGVVRVESPDVYLIDTWLLIEMEILVDPSQGWAKCWVNNVLIVDSGLVANDDRGNPQRGEWGFWDYSGIGVSGCAWLDDVELETERPPAVLKMGGSIRVGLRPFAR